MIEEYQILADRIEAKKQDLINDLARGTAIKNIEDYRYLVGQIRGIETVMGIIVEILQETEQSDS